MIVLCNNIYVMKQNSIIYNSISSRNTITMHNGNGYAQVVRGGGVSRLLELSNRPAFLYLTNKAKYLYIHILSLKQVL